MDFRESYQCLQYRAAQYTFHVIDQAGHEHIFKSAALANAQFPGAFDDHPDFEDTE